ncbi:MAG: PIN domain-containing protein [Patescibacteria group bacterium]|nr:PIN domain-containing protein [Patescibacteria group bacterium]
MIFVDTNYFLRFFLRDSREQYLIVKQFFLDGASGKLKLFTSLIVLFEVYWVLKSYYGNEKNDLIKTLYKILQFTFIDLPERQSLEKSLIIYEKENLSLEDCYNLVYSLDSRASSFATFDKKLSQKFKDLNK